MDSSVTIYLRRIIFIPLENCKYIYVYKLVYNWHKFTLITSNDGHGSLGEFYIG